MTTITKEDGKRALTFDKPRLLSFINSITERFPFLDTTDFTERMVRVIESKDTYKASQITTRLLQESLDRTGIDAGQHPNYQFIAAEVYLRSLYKQAAANRMYDAADKYGDFYTLVKTLTTEGIYTTRLLEEYSKEEIKELGAEIAAERDLLFNYAGLKTLTDRYTARNHVGELYELPQERFLIIAMFLMINEAHAFDKEAKSQIWTQELRQKRMQLVKEAYWALSNLYMTVATPTLSNAGKSYGQLSSCFIDTVDDSLRGIYDSNTDIATLSKNGGGIGVYFGKIRAEGGSIKGFKGIAGSLVRWIKQLNNTAVSVDQLGQRQGSIATYLDVWHLDIFKFLDLRLNNGDERQRAHDIFTGVCLPNLFMEQVEKRGSWYLFDPHEVRALMGWKDSAGNALGLEDFYDETDDKDADFRRRVDECIKHPLLRKQKVNAIDIMKAIMKSQLETGTPYMFYRDTVNRANPNKHVNGVGRTSIYSSNLCTEIMQNMSPTIVQEEILEEDGTIIVRKQAGDFVVCNLSSINLGRAVPDGILWRLIPIEVRMLDNVIELNEDKIEVLQAVHTNRTYRAIGLGTFGWHHLLAKLRIEWESDEAVAYADEIYGYIAQLTIMASAELAQEKGSYSLHEGSEWQTGKYFERRGYTGSAWEHVKSLAAKGMRNAWLMSPAPNGSTSVIAGSTASIDPVFKAAYSEEKKNGKMPVVAPDLNISTARFYKSAYAIDQQWSIKQNGARAKHVDQSSSFNLYVANDIKATEFLELHMQAWKQGIKTTYYVRSTSIEIEECEWCAS